VKHPELLFGSFLTPLAEQPDRVVALAQLSEQAGLDLVTFQDHPYQPAFLDTWTLLSWVGAVTSRIRLAPNVLNLPLRQPLVVARSAASLDRLTGGRVELGLGAGAFWDGIEAAGGRRLSPGQAVDALEEAVAVMRQVWAADQRGGVRVEGEHHRVVGAERGPAPVHPIGIWIGAYKPRMLRLTGRVADGWLPSLGYLPGGPADLAEMNRHLDDGAAEAGRDPAAIRRLLNVSGTFSSTGSPTRRGLLDGPARQWAEELAAISLEHRITGFVLGSDDPADLQRFGEEVAPAVRELVAAEAHPPARPPARRPAADPGPRPAEPDPVHVATSAGSGLRATPAPGKHLTDRVFWDETTRPRAPEPPAGQGYTDQSRAVGNHLVDVHDHLRGELARVRDLVEQVERGALSAAAARSAINEMSMRQNDWTLGAYCASYCRVVTTHHTLEDESIFPHLRRAEPALAPVVDRLEDEHVVIAEVLEGVDRALVAHIAEPADFTGLHRAVDELTDALLSHLAYEEQQIVEPLARHGFFPGQV
jgi:alkanesulfonate monooxygenase SsuD/methylene tetrahydromethanopterin reductase-like flavin-dependent oxidoreductase (luciferase family)